MNTMNLQDLKNVIGKVRYQKKKLKNLMALKRKLESGSFLDLAIMAMLKEEKRNHLDKSILAELETKAGAK